MLGSFLYLEFLVPVRDYFSTINKKELLFEWGLPFLFSFIAYFYLSIGGIQYQNNVNKLNSEIRLYRPRDGDKRLSAGK
jgi:hypothetical protein